MSRLLAHCSLSQWDGSSLSVGPTNDSSSDACLLGVMGQHIDQLWSERQSGSAGTVLCSSSVPDQLFVISFYAIHDFSTWAFAWSNMKAVCTCLATVDSLACQHTICNKHQKLLTSGREPLFWVSSLWLCFEASWEEGLCWLQLLLSDPAASPPSAALILDSNSVRN